MNFYRVAKWHSSPKMDRENGNLSILSWNILRVSLVGCTERLVEILRFYRADTGQAMAAKQQEGVLTVTVR